MSYPNPSDEIADDFRSALNDLNLNSRYEISNLTVIAKEHTEHAFAIAEALKSHIKSVAPPKKLPAFYVLDSVVKNVGTPYTLFFGRQLYSTFMEAYALVDNNTRAKMVEMLKTWKEPVPGSMDTHPVFPPEVTRPIENALIKAKTSFLQAHQEHTRSQQHTLGRGRGGPSPAPYRETPTPPAAYQQPPPQQQALGYQAAGYPGPATQASSYQAQSYQGPVYQAQGQQQGYQAPGYQVPAQQAQAYPGSGYQGPGFQPQGYQNSGYSVQAPVQDQSPGYASSYAQPQYNQQSNGQQYGQANGQQSYAQQPYSLPPRPQSQQYSQPPQANGGYWQSQQQPQTQDYGSVEDDGLAQLNNDIERLIALTRTEWPQNPHDPSIQAKLKALLDLQTVLRSQKLPPDQIALIKNQVAQLSRPSQPAPIIHTPPQPIPTPVVAAPQPPAQQNTLSALLGGPGALAALLARSSATPQPAPATQASSILSPAQTHVQPPYQPPTSNGASSKPAENHNALLERLRAAGLLGGGTVPTPPPFKPTATGMPPGFPPPFMNTPPSNSRTPLVVIPNDVVLKAASLKIPRPHLISTLYEGLGVPCSQCGRRFKSDEESRKKKAAHMDWHFHVRQRMEEAESRGQHRSWYVDELDWIKSREVEGESGAIVTESAHGSTNISAAAPKLQFLPVPDDPALANSVCPICQEKFEMKWLDEAQEFVWMDAKKIGEKIYHASCHAEATKDVSAQIKRGTPEPVLGKRKAEEELMALRTKIKAEPEA